MDLGRRYDCSTTASTARLDRAFARLARPGHRPRRTPRTSACPNYRVLVIRKYAAGRSQRHRPTVSTAALPVAEQSGHAGSVTRARVDQQRLDDSTADRQDLHRWPHGHPGPRARSRLARRLSCESPGLRARLGSGGGLLRAARGSQPACRMDSRVAFGAIMPARSAIPGRVRPWRRGRERRRQALGRSCRRTGTPGPAGGWSYWASSHVSRRLRPRSGVSVSCLITTSCEASAHTPLGQYRIVA